MDRKNHIEERFRILIYSYLSNQITTDEKADLLNWLRASEENKRLFSEYRKIYQLSSRFNSNNRFTNKKREAWEILQKEIDESEKPDELSSQTNNMSFYFKRAASVIIIFSIGALASFWLTKVDQTPVLGNLDHEIIVPLGGKSELVLPDGTKVWLNAGSRFTYKGDYGLNNRNVTLVGEAYFSVKKNPEKPFIVETSGLKIKAYGTSFNVKAYPEEKKITTTLVEGIVKIEGQGVNISLRPKQRVILEKKDNTVQAEKSAPSKSENTEPEIKNEPETKFNDIVQFKNDVNTEIYTSWKDNLWIVESASLKEMAKVLERKFNVNIQIESEELNKFNFTGTFNKETLEQILNVLKITAPIDYRINKGDVLIRMENKRKATYNDFFK